MRTPLHDAPGSIRAGSRSAAGASSGRSGGSGAIGRRVAPSHGLGCVTRSRESEGRSQPASPSRTARCPPRSPSRRDGERSGHAGVSVAGAANGGHERRIDVGVGGVDREPAQGAERLAVGAGQRGREAAWPAWVRAPASARRSRRRAAESAARAQVGAARVGRLGAEPEGPRAGELQRRRDPLAVGLEGRDSCARGRREAGDGGDPAVRGDREHRQRRCGSAGRRPR